MDTKPGKREPMPSGARRSITLPSGRLVVMDRMAWPDRPWSTQEAGGLYVVVRDKRGRKGDLETFKGARLAALPLDRTDAEALCAALNDFVTPKASERTLPTWMKKTMDPGGDA